MKKVNYFIMIALLVLIAGCASSNGHTKHLPSLDTGKFIPSESDDRLTQYDYSRLNDHGLIVFTYDFTGLSGHKKEGIRVIEVPMKGNKNSDVFNKIFRVDGVQTLHRFRGVSTEVQMMAIRGKVVYGGCLKIDVSDIDNVDVVQVLDKRDELNKTLSEKNCKLNIDEIEVKLMKARIFAS